MPGLRRSKRRRSAEPGRERRRVGRARRLPADPPERDRADAHLLPAVAGACVPVPGLLVPLPAVGGRLLDRPARGGRRRRVLRAHRRLSLRSADGTPVYETPAVTTDVLMDDDFDEHVRAALDSLPRELAQGLENVAVVVEDEHPGDPGLFGTFFGVPRTERSWQSPPTPASWRRRSGSRCCTSSRTTSGSTRRGSTSSATGDHVPERRRDRGGRRRRRRPPGLLLRALGLTFREWARTYLRLHRREDNRRHQARDRARHRAARRAVPPALAGTRRRALDRAQGGRSRDRAPLGRAP